MTVVLAHRGHGLGRCLKAHMLRSLLAELPEINRIFTNVNAGNDHMIRVNRQVGFTTTGTTVAVRAVIAIWWIASHGPSSRQMPGE